MSRRRTAPDFIENLTDDALDAREALYIRLLLGQPIGSPITEALHLKLCQVRAEQFTRN